MPEANQLATVDAEPMLALDRPIDGRSAELPAPLPPSSRS
jgi:hypothetical protein